MKYILMLSLLTISVICSAGPRSDFETQTAKRMASDLRAEIKSLIESNYKLDFERMTMEAGDDHIDQNLFVRSIYAADSKNTCKVTLLYELGKPNFETPDRHVKCYKK